tara:strand:+ start:678 stop:2585 length:1908 start_codon:yes stop_codon:yes gene_type:complete
MMVIKSKKAKKSSKAKSARAGSKSKTNQGIILKVAGPVVQAKLTAAINDLVRVGTSKLLGEVIQIEEEVATIQVYEDTTGLSPGEPIINTKQALSVALGPGLLGGVFDGTQRPLDVIAKGSSVFIPKGVDVPALNQKKSWKFSPLLKKGAEVTEGQIIGTVKENPVITHKIMVPVGTKGKLLNIKSGEFSVTDTIAEVQTKSKKIIKITMQQHWPVRIPRPFQERIGVEGPLVSGQRIIDFVAPIAKGGVAAIPGPFGSGKTVTQQQFAKWCDADIIVYVGCGERGNEMTEVLEEFPNLKDPKSGKALMNRTILVANTSNMPVAARESCVYTGVTIAEYFRDQGYAVALMADSTSRWAEAMREISGRLEEMPGEEGYPAYLAKRLAEFYERAGKVTTLAGSEGSVSIIGAVSPPGGDFSEPVTQNTLRISKCFWALDAKLADKRHFPAINWLRSYSLYSPITDSWYNHHVGPEWGNLRHKTANLLQQESELQEIVQLVGIDSLPASQQLLLFIARLIREDFLQQNAFHQEDTFCPLKKQLLMIKGIFQFYESAAKLADDLDLEKLRKSSIAEYLAGLKYEANNLFTGKELKKIELKITKEIELALKGAMKTKSRLAKANNKDKNNGQSNNSEAKK